MNLSESRVTQDILLRCSELGIRMFRNNSGCLKNEHGTMVRFGLGNTSVAVNKQIKSSDLIGIMPCGRFIALEVKAGGWKRRIGDPHQDAQERFMDLIRSLGGVAGFISDVSQLEGLL